MKNILLAIWCCWSVVSYAQKLKITTLYEGDISIRAIQLWDHKVWYVGTHSQFGFVDLDRPKEQKQIRLSETDLQFRTLAQTADNFFAINILSPAYVFKISKQDLKVEKVFKDENKAAFYDALHFINNEKAFAFSDSDNGVLKLLTTQDGGESWQFSHAFDQLKLQKGEAAFAASNTNITGAGKYVWIATGGKASRIFRLNLDNQKAQVFTTPFVQGSSSQGIYSIDFANEKFGIAVGGDYTRQQDNENNIATTNDGGATWQVQASGQNAGYMTCVQIKPGSQGKEILALGDQHISYSKDYGKTWHVISNEKNLYVFQWLNENTIVAAGKNRILKITLY